MKRAHIVLGTTILALGILSVVPTICAAEPLQLDANGNAAAEPFAPDARVSLRLPLQTTENFSFGAVTESPAGEPDASELNRELSNPVSSLWSISNQFNNFELNNGQWNNNWNFQPVLPVSPDQRLEPDHAAGDALLQHRPARGASRRIRAGHRAGRSGSGGVAVACALGQLDSRSRAYRHLPDCDIGVHWPGQMAAWAHFRGRLPNEAVLHWRVSPAMVVHRRAALPAGHEPDEPATHRIDLLREGWSLGYSGNILADWNAPSHNVWTVPVGLGLGKVVKFGRLPVKIQLAVQYMPVHPRISGQEWNVQVSITPVLPKLIKGILFQ